MASGVFNVLEENTQILLLRFLAGPGIGHQFACVSTSFRSLVRRSPQFVQVRFEQDGGPDHEEIDGIEKFKANVYLAGHVVGGATLSLVHRGPGFNFLEACDDHSHDLHHVSVQFCNGKGQPRLACVKCTKAGGPPGGFLYMDRFQLTMTGALAGNSTDLGTAAIRSMLCTTELAGRWSLAVYIPEGGQGEIAQQDSRPFIRAGFRQAAELVQTSKCYHFFAVASFLRAPPLSHADALAVPINQKRMLPDGAASPDDGLINSDEDESDEDESDDVAALFGEDEANEEFEDLDPYVMSVMARAASLIRDRGGSAGSALELANTMGEVEAADQSEMATSIAEQVFGSVPQHDRAHEMIQRAEQALLQHVAVEELRGLPGVIEEVAHPEPAANIPPAEAQAVVEQQWAQLVGGQMAQGNATAVEDSAHVGAAEAAANESTSAWMPQSQQECLLPTTFVLTRAGPVSVLEACAGCELVPGRPGHEALIRSSFVHESCERRVVNVHCQGELECWSLTVTMSHPLMVLRPSCQLKAFQPMLASEVQRGDHLRTRRGAHATVTRVEHDMLDTKVVEIQLMDVSASFFVGDGSSDTFVEACGALVPLRGSLVSILRFQRYDKFREVFRQSPLLAACREQLERDGWSIDLGELGEPNVGPAKLFVRVDMAWRVIEALRLRGIQQGPLHLSDVVVAEEFKQLVLEAVIQHAPRANPVVRQETLPLGPVIQVRRTFIEAQNGSATSDVTAHSSTDAHIGLDSNPRKRKAVDM